jgi:hypothetical protein
LGSAESPPPTDYIHLRGPEDVVGESVLLGPLTRVRLGAASAVACRAIEDPPRALGTFRKCVKYSPVAGKLFRTRVHRDPSAAQSDHRDLLAARRDRTGPDCSCLERLQQPWIQTERRADPGVDSKPLASRYHPVPPHSAALRACHQWHVQNS